jgi:hypothetical protein
MPKYTFKQIVIAAIVVILLAGASTSVRAATGEPGHAYTTTSSGVKAGFGFGLLALGAVGVVTFLSRSLVEKIRR